jgi:hypothetical protein
MLRLRHYFIAGIIIGSAIALGTVSAMAQNVLKGSVYQIANPSIDIHRFTNDLNDGQVPIVASDDPA